MGAKHSRKTGSAMADRKFIDEVIKAHNDYRKRHQAASLSYSKELSAQAQKWADHLASTGSSQHSGATLKGEKLGENIAMKWSSSSDAFSGQEVTDQWYSEVRVHVFGTEPSMLRSGHFTQLVWKGSKEVGVGKAVACDGKVIVVANYKPAGNMAGSFAVNVLPPKDGKIVLPAEPAPQKTTSTTHFSSRSRGGGSEGGFDGGGVFSQRFEDMRKDMFSGGMTTTGSRSESRSVRTYTVTEGVGANKVTKTITEETIIKNGEKTVNRKETITSGGTAPSSQSSHLQSDFGRLALKDHQPAATDSKTKQKKSKPFWKRRSSSSSSDSSLERGGSSSKNKKATVAPGKTSRTGKPQKMSDFQKSCLQAHNTKRALHGAPPLSLAADLSEHAQKWADHLASSGMFQHSNCIVNKERVGENIANKWSSSGADYTGDQVVDQWYSEIQKHNFKMDGSIGSGHFTQLVWKGSRELGVGKAQDGKGKVIAVCNYRPPGNMRGAFLDNVFPPK